MLNLLVTSPTPAADTSYRLAPGLAARLVGRSLVTLAVLVGVATGVGQVIGAGWAVPATVAVVGLVLVSGWAWWLLRRASVVRLTAEGYGVRLLRGIGVARAPWGHVAEAVATNAQGQPCLVVGLVDGRTTRLPMAALADDGDGDGEADSAEADGSL